ncbi:MAG: hypothetical protein ACN4GM_06315 [Gammaproteobacteria bacterium]
MLDNRFNLVTAVLIAILAISGNAIAGKGNPSGFASGSAQLSKNEFGNTHRYKKQLGDKPAYQYRNTYRHEYQNGKSNTDKKSKK